jgi:hypothetical protein
MKRDAQQKAVSDVKFTMNTSGSKGFQILNAAQCGEQTGRPV